MAIVAFVREIPSTFADALVATPTQKIDLATAHREHAAYRVALAAMGARVIVLPADDACPDCVFVEDTAVVAGTRAIVTRPGAPSRRAETPPIASILEDYVTVVEMTEPATLDGGDCMRVGRTIFVGRSQRTNAAGIAQLAEAFPDHGIVPIDLPPGVLHLKCVTSPLGDDRILLAEGSLDPALFDGLSIVTIPRDELYAANAVAIDGHVLVAAEFPRTHEILANAGFALHPVPTTQVRRADGSLTCQSILVTLSR